MLLFINSNLLGQQPFQAEPHEQVLIVITPKLARGVGHGWRGCPPKERSDRKKRGEKARRGSESRVFQSSQLLFFPA